MGHGICFITCRHCYKIQDGKCLVLGSMCQQAPSVLTCIVLSNYDRVKDIDLGGFKEVARDCHKELNMLL